jgi:hypothetical protein
MATNAKGVVGVLDGILTNAQKIFSNAVGRSGASPFEKGKVGATAVGKIADIRSALPKPANLEEPASPVVVGQSAENKGKTILDHLSKGLDRFLLSIHICIVLLRAKDVNMDTVNSALGFVRELKGKYDALCASVTGAPTNNAKVSGVKAVLDELVALQIPGPLNLSLQNAGEAKRQADAEFVPYSAQVKAEVGAAFPDLLIAPALPMNMNPAIRLEEEAKAAANAAAAKLVANAANAKAAANAVKAALLPAGPPPPPVLAPLPAGLQLPTANTPKDFVDTATKVNGNIALFQYIKIDANKFVKGAPLASITKDVKIYAVSYVTQRGLRTYELVSDANIKQTGNTGITITFNNAPTQNLPVYFYTNPSLKTKGGRRRTKANGKAKAKASRKSTRRNRRS